MAQPLLHGIKMPKCPFLMTMRLLKMRMFRASLGRPNLPHFTDEESSITSTDTGSSPDIQHVDLNADGLSKLYITGLLRTDAVRRLTTISLQLDYTKDIEALGRLLSQTGSTLRALRIDMMGLMFFYGCGSERTPSKPFVRYANLNY